MNPPWDYILSASDSSGNRANVQGSIAVSGSSAVPSIQLLVDDKPFNSIQTPLYTGQKYTLTLSCQSNTIQQNIEECSLSKQASSVLFNNCEQSISCDLDPATPIQSCPPQPSATYTAQCEFANPFEGTLRVKAMNGGTVEQYVYRAINVQQPTITLEVDNKKGAGFQPLSYYTNANDATTLRVAGQGNLYNFRITCTSATTSNIKMCQLSEVSQYIKLTPSCITALTCTDEVSCGGALGSTQFTNTVNNCEFTGTPFNFWQIKLQAQEVSGSQNISNQQNYIYPTTGGAFYQ